MGNREKLLVGAKQCVLENGYRRTTARDIATTAGVSLAAIGYHFRSTQALLTEAILDGIGDWAERFEEVLADQALRDLNSMDRFEAVWTGVIETLDGYRGYLAASYEVMPQLEHNDILREQMTTAVHGAREGLTGLFLDVDVSAEPGLVGTAGSLYYAIMSGVITQWLIDPERAPSGADLAAGLRAVITGTTSPGNRPSGRKPRQSVWPPD
ncbi:MAG: TetR/AcrR family transcriptional regulator [Tomitella sp.]|nr:TetR/AcrR family transcriptional regulator [Tomitella sp.]